MSEPDPVLAMLPAGFVEVKGEDRNKVLPKGALVFFLKPGKGWVWQSADDPAFPCIPGNSGFRFAVPVNQPAPCDWNTWSAPDLMKEIRDRMKHFYGQTDGTLKVPNSAEGDILKMVALLLDKLGDGHNPKRVAGLLEGLELSLADDMTLSGAVCRGFDPAKDFSPIVAFLRLQQRYLNLCAELGYKPTRKLTGVSSQDEPVVEDKDT
jgi:hypothetical protein